MKKELLKILNVNLSLLFLCLGNTELTGQEELMEISEVDEGFYSRAASNTSQSGLSNSNHNSSNKTSVGKTQRRSGGSKTGGKEKETTGESCKDRSLCSKTNSESPK